MTIHLVMSKDDTFICIFVQQMHLLFFCFSNHQTGVEEVTQHFEK